jgi:predicted DNA-binding transcriptional regulator YafY
MRADRLVRIVMLLQTKGRMTAGELAEELEISKRTIYRDVDALCAAGVPVVSELGPNGGFALPPGYRTGLTGLTLSEVQAVLASGGLPVLEDLGFGRALEGARLKLAAALPLAFRRGAEEVGERIHLDPVSWFTPEEAVPHLATVQEAVLRGYRLCLTYRSDGGRRDGRLVDPYGLVAKVGVWYLVGSEAGRISVLRVSRLQDAEVTGERFDRPESFDLAAWWADWCARIEASRPKHPVILHLATTYVPVAPSPLGDSFRLLPRIAAEREHLG